MIVVGNYGFMLVIPVHLYLFFLFLDNNLSNYQWILTKLGMCIDIVKIWFGIANGQISALVAKCYRFMFLYDREIWKIVMKFAFSYCCKSETLA